jgi:hypothetical protein
MAGKLVKHVIEEGDPSRNIALTTAIKPNTNKHVGFSGDAMNIPLP